MSRDREDREDRGSRRDDPKPKKPPVIEVSGPAGLSAGEALQFRLLPAAVVSAGLHLIVALLAFVCTLLFTKTETVQARQQVDVAVEDSSDAARPENLTEVTQTLDPDKGDLAVQDAKLDDVTGEKAPEVLKTHLEGDFEKK